MVVYNPKLFLIIKNLNMQSTSTTSDQKVQEEPGRVEPPFPALQSFNAASVVLSYVDYDYKVSDLLF